MPIDITFTNTVANDDAAKLHRLRSLLCECAHIPSRHDQAILLIGACIAEGMDETRRILPAMETLGFDRNHAAIVLKRNTTAGQNMRVWSCDASGRYSLNESHLINAAKKIAH